MSLEHERVRAAERCAEVVGHKGRIAQVLGQLGRVTGPVLGELLGQRQVPAGNFDDGFIPNVGQGAVADVGSVDVANVGGGVPSGDAVPPPHGGQGHIRAVSTAKAWQRGAPGRWLRTDPWDTGFVDLAGDQGILGLLQLIGLDRPQLPVVILGHRVDPSVAARAARPVLPQPHPPQQWQVGRIDLKKPFANVLELPPAELRVLREAVVQIAEVPHGGEFREKDGQGQGLTAPGSIDSNPKSTTNRCSRMRYRPGARR